MINSFFIHLSASRAQSEAVEIYEGVNLVLTLCRETQQVVILLCPPLQRQVLPTTGGQITVDPGQWRKQGNKKV